MTEGLVPYRDLFDHKGPLLYLIQYAGAALTPGSYTGLWILELLNMMATMALMLPACACMSRRRSSAVLAVMLSFLVCGRRLYEGGNLTEEYAMPWIALGMLVFLRYFQTGQLRFGIGVFLLGFCLMLAPFIIWMKAAGFLKEFWECYVLFNFRYAEEVGGGLRHTLHLTGWVLRLTLPAVPLLLLALIKQYRNPHYLAVLLLVAVSIAAAELSGRDYPHYLMILLPPFAAGFAPVFDLTGGWLDREEKKNPHGGLFLSPVLPCV